MDWTLRSYTMGNRQQHWIEQGDGTPAAPRKAIARVYPPDPAVAMLLAAPRVVAALVELSEWMRAHTGPADGTLDMLTSAHDALAAAQGED